MNRSWLRTFVAGCAGCLLAGTAIAADAEPKKDLKKVRFEPRSFYSTYLVPRVDSRLQGEAIAATDYANPLANPWTRDHETVHRVEVSAIRAGKKALKRFVVDSLRMDTWSIPLYETRHSAAASGSGTADSRARLRFGISHLTPRAELLIPAAYGRVAVSADGRGAMGAMFESNSYTFRVDVNYDPREHTGTFTLGRRF